MYQISVADIQQKIRLQNSWWDPPHEIDPDYEKLDPRQYFSLLLPLIKDRSVKRAVVLMGPRRVGKTVLLHHCIAERIASGVRPDRICYISVDAPVYMGLGLEQLLRLFAETHRHDLKNGAYSVFFDEIQYLKQWEVHLKSLVDSYPNIKFVASGSAAAALRVKSTESGAGRFTDFILPPLTFHEYLELSGNGNLVRTECDGDTNEYAVRVADIHEVNALFFDFINYGGYPEVLTSPTIRNDPGRYIRSDIIDKVLLKDLPGLYGIQDIQELNHLFTVLAYNTGMEVSLDKLSHTSGVVKNTIKRYLEYLKAAFLITVVHRVDATCRKFKRANFFKIYLTNPSLRCALIGPVGPDDDMAGHLVETAVLSQWQHSDSMKSIHYARWNSGRNEIDMVYVDPARQKPAWCVEVKWSDRVLDHPREVRSVVLFGKKHPAIRPTVTTRTETKHVIIDGKAVDFEPTAVYCYRVGRTIVSGGVQRFVTAKE